MATVNQEIKCFIVTMLAQYEAERDIIKSVKDQFGVDVSQQQVNSYNPSTKSGQRLGKELKALFAQERKDFLSQLERIPYANKAVRILRIQRIGERADANGNLKLVLEALEQAAKESGDFYTNKLKHEHEVPAGGSLAVLLAGMKRSSLPVKK